MHILKKKWLSTFLFLLIVIISFIAWRLKNHETPGITEKPVSFNELHTQKIISSSVVTWQQFGPGTSGYLETIEYHPTDNECVMMSPDMFNTYASYNNGYTWQSVKDHDGNGGDLLRIRDYSFAEKEPDVGLCLDYNAQLWVTNDRGRNWEKANFDENLCSVVEISPYNSNIIFIGGGDFWHVKFNERRYNKPHHADNDADYGKVWRSDDKGQTWVLKNEGIPKDADIGKIKFHPVDEKTVYAATSHGLFKSTDLGGSWLNIGKGLPRNMLRDLAMHYNNDTRTLTMVVIDQVFWEPDGKGGIESSGGVYKTTNEGKTWECLNNNLYLDVSAMSEPVQNSWYWALSRWFESGRDAAQKKYPVLPSRALQNFNRLLINPVNPDIMYLGHSARHDISFYAGDLWKTEDGGETWISTARIGKGWQHHDRAFWEERGNPVNENMRFAHLHHEVEMYVYPRSGCRALTMNKRGDVMAVFEQQTFISNDNGDSWQQIDDLETSPGSGIWVGTGCSNMPGRRIHMDPRLDGRHYLLSTEHGLWQIVDPHGPLLNGVPSVRQLTGQNENHDPSEIGLYKPYPGTNSIASIALHPNDKNKIYMLVHRQNNVGYLRMSPDGGKTWKNIAKPITEDDHRLNVHQYSFIINKDKPNRMYFCVPSWIVNDLRRQSRGITKFGVYASEDGGYNWERRNQGLPYDYAVNALAFDPSDNDRMYAAVMESTDKSTKGGLFVSTDHAQSWQRLPVPDNIRSVADVNINPVSGNIYIACGLPGGKVANGGAWVSKDKGQTWNRIFQMPLVYNITTAAYDPERIAVNVSKASMPDDWDYNRMGFINHYEDKNDPWNLNPGAYISFDGGKNWLKMNNGIGQPDRILDLEFDLQDPKLMWCALRGSGWYKGTIHADN